MVHGSYVFSFFLSCCTSSFPLFVVDITDTREQFKCRLKGWLFEYTYGSVGRRCVW